MISTALIPRSPSTGTVDGGRVLTTMQGLEIIRGTAGLNLVAVDLVEVSPPYDPPGKHGNDRGGPSYPV